MKARTIYAATAVMALVLVVVAPLAAEPSAPAVKAPNFPTAGVYELHSHPSFLVTVGDSKEVVECNATLVIKASEPYLTTTGRHRVDLQVVHWQADGTSVLLGGELHFRKIDTAKPIADSFVESYQLAGYNDFPAKAQFAVPYEVETPFGTVTGLQGVTRGAIKSFPPHGDLFMMEKGDVGDLVAQLMPEPLYALSAAGEQTTQPVSVEPLACADADSN
jgi:hypothetical protein